MDRLEINSITLDRLKVYARQALSAQMAHDLEMRAFEEFVTDRLIYELRSTVYAHCVGVEKTSVPFSKTVTRPPTKITIASKRRYAIPHAAAALVLALAAVWNTSIGLGIAALAFVALTALTWREGAPYDVVIEHPAVTVAGSVEIEDRLYDVFPDNTVVYPDTLGAAVKLVQPQSPEVFYRYTDDLRGDADR